MSTLYNYNSPLGLDQLRLHLENNDTLVLIDQTNRWQQIERMVDSLGFGEAYLVTFVTGPRGGFTKLTPVKNSRSIAA